MFPGVHCNVAAVYSAGICVCVCVWDWRHHSLSGVTTVELRNWLRETRDLVTQASSTRPKTELRFTVQVWLSRWRPSKTVVEHKQCMTIKYLLPTCLQHLGNPPWWVIVVLNHFNNNNNRSLQQSLALRQNCTLWLHHQKRKTFINVCAEILSSCLHQHLSGTNNNSFSPHFSIVWSKQTLDWRQWQWVWSPAAGNVVTSQVYGLEMYIWQENLHYVFKFFKLKFHVHF